MIIYHLSQKEIESVTKSAEDYGIKTLFDEVLSPGVFKLDFDFGHDGERKGYIKGGDEKGIDMPENKFDELQFTVRDADNQHLKTNLIVGEYDEPTSLSCCSVRAKNQLIVLPSMVGSWL